MKNYLFLLALAAPLVLGSCGKDDDEVVTPKQDTVLTELTTGSSDPAAMQLTTELLTGSRWKLSSFGQAAVNTFIYKNLYSNLPGCQKDDIYQFSATGNSLTITDGLNFCNSNPQTKNGGWSLSNSANITIAVNDLTQPGLTGEFNIVQLSEDEMVLRQTVNGLMYVVTYEKYVPSRAELLVNRNWRLTAETEQIGGWQPTDVFASYQACEKDNFIRFEGNGQLKMDEGATKCSPSDPQTTFMNYYFNGYSTITLNASGMQQQLYIQNLDANTLVVQSNYYTPQGYTYNTKTYTSF